MKRSGGFEFDMLAEGARGGRQAKDAAGGKGERKRSPWAFSAKFTFVSSLRYRKRTLRRGRGIAYERA